RRVPGVRAVAQLAVRVLAPALHATRLQQRAGVEGADRDALDARGEAGNVDRNQAVHVRTVAELAGELVESPALHAVARGERARALAIAGDREGRGRTETDHILRREHRGPAAVAELPVVVAAPALDRAGIEPGADVRASA